MRLLPAASLLVLFIATGCEHTAIFNFQIIDAQTHQGLETVKMEAQLVGNHYGFKSFPADDDPDANLQTRTNTQGQTTLTLKFEKDLHYYIRLIKPGYQAITGEIYPFTGHSSLTRRPSDALPAIGPAHEMPDIPLGPMQTMIIPMHPLGPPK